MWVHDLRDADQPGKGPGSGGASGFCGGKAIGLARLIAAGLPVPPGFVIDHRAFDAVVGELAVDDPTAIGHALERAAERIAAAEIPEELAREVRDRVRELGDRVAVRSSATIEDGPAGAAAGVFSSRRAVPIAGLWEAVRAVWTSALTPLAVAYARRRGGSIAIGVIVQRFVDDPPLTIYTRPPGEPARDQLLIQRSDAALVRYPRSPLPDDPATQHAVIQALRAERAIGASRGADVELVQRVHESGDDADERDARVIETWVVQARPIVHPVADVLTAPPPLVVAALDDGRPWTLDLAHNPDPLSTAQTALVERIERAAAAPWSAKVCAGYLYTSPHDVTMTPVLAGSMVADVATLRARAAAIGAAIEAALGGEPARDVDDAVARYLAFYKIWAGELGPLIAAARRAVTIAPDAILGARPSAVEATLIAAARGSIAIADAEARLGVLAPAWDVAVATYAERPGLIRDAIARVAASATATDAVAVTGTVTVTDAATDAVADSDADPDAALARAAADLAEWDDLLFARAQWLVRRALLARAVALGLDADDACWLPLVLATTDRDELRRRAAAARAAAARAARWAMPIRVGARTAPEAPDAPAELALHGVGTGPRVTGRVVRFASLASAIVVGRGDVVVTRAVTPALAVIVAGCAALVSETGGLLDHGAALARELGIPCVVGCRDVWSRVSDGILVTVDGAAGTVELVTT